MIFTSCECDKVSLSCALPLSHRDSIRDGFYSLTNSVILEFYFAALEILQNRKQIII